MTTKLHPASAKIYQFPANGRAGLRASREAAQSAVERLPTRASRVAVSSGWYHEAALQDAEQVRKH